MSNKFEFAQLLEKRCNEVIGTGKLYENVGEFLRVLKLVCERVGSPVIMHTFPNNNLKMGSHALSGSATEIMSVMLQLQSRERGEFNRISAEKREATRNIVGNDFFIPSADIEEALRLVRNPPEPTPVKQAPATVKPTTPIKNRPAAPPPVVPPAAPTISAPEPAPTPALGNFVADTSTPIHPEFIHSETTFTPGNPVIPNIVEFATNSPLPEPVEKQKRPAVKTPTGSPDVSVQPEIDELVRKQTAEPPADAAADAPDEKLPRGEFVSKLVELLCKRWGVDKAGLARGVVGTPNEQSEAAIQAYRKMQNMVKADRPVLVMPEVMSGQLAAFAFRDDGNELKGKLEKWLKTSPTTSRRVKSTAGIKEAAASMPGETYQEKLQHYVLNSTDPKHKMMETILNLLLLRDEEKGVKDWTGLAEKMGGVAKKADYQRKFYNMTKAQGGVKKIDDHTMVTTIVNYAFPDATDPARDKLDTWLKTAPPREYKKKAGTSSSSPDDVGEGR